MVRTAFTLIEMLIVTAIIATLAGVLIGIVGGIGDTVDERVTKTRMIDIQRRLSEVGTGAGLVSSRIQDVAHGKRMRWAPLRQVIGSQTLAYSSDADVGLDTSVIDRDGGDYFPQPLGAHLPPGIASLLSTHTTGGQPGIGNYFKSDPGATSDYWKRLEKDNTDGIGRRQRNLENTTLFMNFKNFWEFGDRGVIYKNRQVPLGSISDKVVADPQPAEWYKRTHWWVIAGDGAFEDLAKELRWANIYWYESSNGETLSRTKELTPYGSYFEANKKVTGAWYLQEWPTLSEIYDDDGTTLVQKAWPDSDWNQATPGTVPPILEAPFGRPIIARKSGNPTEQHLIRSKGGVEPSLADFSPLSTIDLMDMIGLLPANNAGAYRTDRNRDKEWNDRWGNPLVIGHMAYIAPRYYFDPAGNDSTDPASHGLTVEYTEDLLGGRDFLMETAEEIYGYSRASWISVGALGPNLRVAGTDNDVESVTEWFQRPTWEASDDPVVLRALWLQVTDTCNATAYTSSNAQWSGIRKIERGNEISMLQAPTEYNK
jgi:prepilin-type N-terminal cleavage/methylation domain-containing protein